VTTVLPPSVVDELDHLVDRPWAADLAVALEAITAAAHGTAVDRCPRPRSARRATGRGIAVIPLYGLLLPRSSRFGMSLKAFRDELAIAVSEPNVDAIVIEIDSPGGSSAGIPETAAAIRAAAVRKPVAAVANPLADSGAYWLAAQAGELAVTPSGNVGGIGIEATHRNLRQRLAKRGVEMTLVAAGKRKLDGNPFEPLTDEARAGLQQQVDAVYALFVDDVAAGRGVTPDEVRDGFGQGRTLDAAAAVAAGMADRIATLDEVVRRASKGAVPLRAHVSPATAARLMSLPAFRSAVRQHQATTA
jgi:capsid assembly protease